MRIDMWTLGLQAINLIVLVWILSRYLFKPIGAILAQRQAQARTILDDAEAERSQAAAALRLARDEEQSLAANRDARLRQAQTEAETSASAILEQARAEAAHIVALARAEAERDAQQRREARESSALHLAADIAEALLQRLPAATRIAGFAEGLGAALSQLPERSRRDIGANGSPCRILAARPLSAEEQASLVDALARALGRRPDIEVGVDPDLIAGFELQTAHVRVVNSLREDLHRIQKELTAHERS